MTTSSKRFGPISIDTIPQERQRVETFSYLGVCARTVVGRDDDAREIIGKLLDYANPVNFLTIVGMGGVGKTTLAKLVFDEEWIKSEFDLRLWVCVSDQGGAPLNLKDILVKILELLNCKRDSSSSVEYLRGEYQRQVEEKKVLLVLDDVWSESTLELEPLKTLLMVDGRSRIIATTRSMKMAGIVGGGIHELQGLSNDNSQHLFEMTVFGNEPKSTDFVEIAEEIVEKCCNIPLVIMVVGSLLRGQPIGKWQTFLMSEFSEFVKDENDIMSVLKLSYDHLDPSLKSCFAYCAIFPKDYVISKEVLTDLWKAQGYIVPFREGQSIESAGEEHFSILLQRCFFQDVKRDEYGDVESFKIHDLMHDLAQRVSGNEICVTNSSTPDLEGNIRHLFVYRLIDSNMPNSKSSLHHLLCGRPINTDDFNNKSKIRSYLMFRSSGQVELGEELSSSLKMNWGCIRALALQSTNVRLPDTVGNLLHLRYLNLAYSKMKKLPDSIVRLHNLQTLNINHCKFLEEWPKEFSKLVNLTHLYIDFCSQLRYMPVGISKLSRIRTLTEFAVEDEGARGTQRGAQLRDLKDLAMNLKCRISIRFYDLKSTEELKSTKEYEWEGSCLEDAKHLNEVKLNFYSPLIPTYLEREMIATEEVVMEKLKPHPNLRKFSLSNYAGEKITSWGRARVNWGTFFPHLVHIELIDCCQLQEVPMFSKLPYLKSLSLIKLKKLKYMEEVGSLDTTFFPSLESLEVYFLTSLSRWWKSGDTGDNQCQPSFPKLSKLSIRNCINLKSFPHCLSRPKLYWVQNDDELTLTTADGVQISPEPYKRPQW
ncbi:putative disease resistance protein RGA3 isoform X2 [Silene latifolia]|uniref:putative disease resistance protein RGA3 isoform X2 n=1 Tax=Silene latifolia TaxID=37657 RepID=UPI003D76FD37